MGLIPLASEEVRTIRSRLVASLVQSGCPDEQLRDRTELLWGLVIEGTLGVLSLPQGPTPGTSPAETCHVA